MPSPGVAVRAIVSKARTRITFILFLCVQFMVEDLSSEKRVTRENKGKKRKKRGKILVLDMGMSKTFGKFM